MTSTAIVTDTHIVAGTYNLPARIFMPTHDVNCPSVLFVHGFNSSQVGYAERAQAMAALGVASLTFNLRGHGDDAHNLGLYSRQDHLADVLAAYDFLAERIPSRPIVVCGASYGAYLACILSGERALAGLCLRVPALYADDDFTVSTVLLKERDPDVIRRRGIPIADNRALSALAQFVGPLLICESRNDKVIPHATIQTYIEARNPAAPFSHVVLEGADHALTQQRWRDQFLVALTSWYKGNYLSRGIDHSLL